MAMEAGCWLLKGTYWIDTNELVGTEVTSERGE